MLDGPILEGTICDADRALGRDGILEELVTCHGVRFRHRGAVTVHDEHGIAAFPAGEIGEHLPHRGLEFLLLREIVFLEDVIRRFPKGLFLVLG